MADVSTTVLIHREATNVIATRVTDYLEETVEVCVIIFAAVNLTQSDENEDQYVFQVIYRNSKLYT